MGVHGLWRLIEPSGKPVPLETLENKVLAVDVSIWLHQLVKGFQDSKGAPVPNAHLLGIYHRICKLLYFRIRPVFVFDGGVPVLKKQTMAKRNQQKSKNLSEAERIHKNLLSTLLKHSAISKVLSEKAKAAISATLPATSPPKKSKKEEDDLYVLPSTQSLDSTLSSSDDEGFTEDSNPARQYDLHSIDTNSIQFKSLPVDVRHEILTDLKETRKQSSWGRLHEMPTESDDFATYQMRRLLKRQSVQTALEEVEKEMGGHTLSLGELEKILKDQGVISNSNIKGSRIASDENTRFLLIKDIKQAVENAKKQATLLPIEEAGEEEQQEEEEKEGIQKEDTNEENSEKAKNKGDIEYEEDLKRAIALSLEDEPSTSKDAKETTPENVKNVGSKGKKRVNFSFLEDFNDADFFDSESSEEELTPTKLTPAQRYMMEYSGLTAHEISKIIASKRGPSKKTKFEDKKISSENVNTDEKRIDLDQNEKIARLVEEIINPADDEETADNEINNKDVETADNEINNKDVETTYNEINNKDVETTFSLDDERQERQEKTAEEGEKIINRKSESEAEKNQSAKIAPHEGDTHKPGKIVVLQNIEISKSIRGSNENPHETEGKKVENIKENEEKQTEVELMSESESSSCEDFLEVEECSKDKSSIVPSMEVVIKPDEEMEDDLFKDIFAKEDMDAEKSQNENLETVMEKELPSKITESIEPPALTSEKQAQDETEKRLTEKPSSEQENVPSLKAKITKMIEDYSKTTKTDGNENTEISVEQMTEIRENLSKEQEELIAERSTKERLAGNITDQMYQEAQELLELFGVPYLIAPMEAEAQCAFLELISLTDGTITDDSDIWLFGGRTVYKNFFNQSKTVLEFKSDNIHQHFKLTREQMVLLAMLVGSDYTIGLSGVGPVTALEILAAFPPKNQLLSGLMEFRSWFNKGKLPGPGRTGLRSKLKNVTFSENFPNPQIVQAYLEPQVETSKEKFSWAKPDVVGLVDFARQKFGWTKQKTEEILNPILKRLESRDKQKAITDYFKMEYKIDSGETESKMSKRVKTAITKIGKHGTASEGDEEEPEQKKKKKTAKKDPNKVGERKVQSKSNAKRGFSKKPKENVDEDIKILKQTEAQSEKRLEELHNEIQKKFEEQQAKKKVSLANLHKKEVIPQKQKEKSDILRNKLKAIETFRKSKQGPGYVKKRAKSLRTPKEDASYLSESSDSD